MATVAERMIEVISDQLGVDKERLTPETDFANDLTADSLDAVELILEAEEEFDISISDSAVEETQTVGQAIALVESLIAERDAKYLRRQR